MSNKSEATWHPNTGPVTDHADLIARLRVADDWATKHKWNFTTVSASDVRELLAALADSVPRTQSISAEDVDAYFVREGIHTYREILQLGEDSDASAEKAERERDEARAERDALAAQLAEVDDVVGDPEHPRFGATPGVRKRMYAIVKAATANEEERDRILARHDAEVKAQALDEAAESFATGEWSDAFIAGKVHDDVTAVKATEAWLSERAAAIRAEDE